MTNNKQAVRELLHAIAHRDVVTLNRLVSTDVAWWAPVSAQVDRPLRGREAVVGLLSGTYGFFQPDTTTWTVIALVEEDLTVVAHVRRQCLATNGRPYENEYLLRFDFDGGEIAEAWEQTDTAYAFLLFEQDPV
jgi:ketosteroid isomerase-like protein